MCGITGIWCFNEVGRFQMTNLEKSTRSLEHRGPDDHGTWNDHLVGLGHRRLSIIDTSDLGHQPMQILDGRYIMVFNGEIFNYQQLRKELESKGVRFESETDTEVIMHLYAQEGKACLSRLNGFFALAIYDTQKKTCLIARDRIGIKPLLYYQDEFKVLFASEMQAILAYGMDQKVDKDALHYYLQLNYTPAPLTMVEGVKKLMPGECIEIIDQEIRLSRYYHVDETRSPLTELSYEQAIKELKSRLDASVQKRMMADVPLGAFLSGGIDSSVISSLAARHTDHLSTFSIGFEGNKFFDETQYAEAVAKKIGSNHTTFRLSNDEIFSNLDDFVRHIDEPFADSSSLPVYILSKKTRRHVTVALSGDGADEIFSGYNKHAAWYEMENGGLKSLMIKLMLPMASRMPKSRSGFLANKMRQVMRYEEAKKLSPKDRYWFLASLGSAEQSNNLVREPSLDSEYFERWMTGMNEYKDINDLMKMDAAFVLPNDMLKKVDMMSMAAGLEVRVPFLDHELVEFVQRLPFEYKINGKMRKRILQDTYRDILPPELYRRPKKGFEMPLLDWLKSSLRGELDQYLFDQERIEDGGVFNWNQIKNLREKLHSSNPEDSHAHVWALYVFQKWHSRHF
ncbi:asparagine synthase (glutamine-hydrolyzing) [Reichenbachiella ulvae]|uniref:asparagine synthase (glutamine-hydrolyzing) n=1 Tax=Reichenbachiella ulvae TaxID=2980104 RepID=A0ABT3CWH3_9BACT|nr:asparagine synthase (glutamine-hydrolyzing) [Reichenbachiella ulvae]MCV9388055.1 asparagine synthase (glutamine-hydrolyzing) [Reichenbachiella ulvae]